MTATTPWIELSIPTRRPARPRPKGLGFVLVAILISGLGLSALRVHVTELRYQRAEALELEKRLQDEERALTVELQGLKDPMRLQALAKARGFTTPVRLMELPVRTAAR